MESPEDRFIEAQYMEGANLASDRTRMTKPIMVPVSKDKSGIDEVDIEILVMRRALARIQRHASLPQQTASTPQKQQKPQQKPQATPMKGEKAKEGHQGTPTPEHAEDAETTKADQQQEEAGDATQQETLPTMHISPNRSSHNGGDPRLMGMSIQVDVDVISHSIDRLMKVLRSARVTSEEVDLQVKKMVALQRQATQPDVGGGGVSAAIDPSNNLSAVASAFSSKPPTPQQGMGRALCSNTTPTNTAAGGGAAAVAASSGTGGATTALTSPGGVKFQVSPSYQARRKENAQRVMRKNRANTEIDNLRRRAAQGLWGSLVQVLAGAEGDYKLILHKEEVAARGLSITAEAKVFGLASLGSALTTKALPQVTIRGVDLPEGTPEIAQDRVLPAGCISYLQGRGIPVIANASSCWGSHHISAIIDRTSLKPFMTKSVECSSVTVDFGGAVVRPTAYGFASIHNILPGYFPRDWDLLGSMDGVKWTLIREHRGENCFKGRVPTCLWQLDSGTDVEICGKDGKRKNKSQDDASSKGRSTTSSSASAGGGGGDTGAEDMIVCRSMKIEITGPNSFGTDELQVSAFEVYGSVMMVEETEVPTLKSAGVVRLSPTPNQSQSGASAEQAAVSPLDKNESVRIRRSGFSAVEACPDISTLTKKKGGGKK